MKDLAARRHWLVALAFALVLCIAPAAGAQEPVPPATYPAQPPAPVPVPSITLPPAPLLQVLAVETTKGRSVRIRCQLARDAVISIGLRRLPTGTLVTRRYRVPAGQVTWTIGRRLRAGRYGIRVIANDYTGERASVRAAPVRFSR